jgi:hypothetical protein
MGGFFSSTAGANGQAALPAGNYVKRGNYNANQAAIKKRLNGLEGQGNIAVAPNNNNNNNNNGNITPGGAAAAAVLGGEPATPKSGQQGGKRRKSKKSRRASTRKQRK